MGDHAEIDQLAALPDQLAALQRPEEFQGERGGQQARLRVAFRPGPPEADIKLAADSRVGERNAGEGEKISGARCTTGGSGPAARVMLPS